MSDRKEPTPCPEHAIKPDPPPAPPKPYVRGVQPGVGRIELSRETEGQLGLYQAGYQAGIQAERARILALIDTHLQHEWRWTVDRLKEAIRGGK